MSFMWPQESPRTVLGDMADEYVPEAGILPAQGINLQISHVRLDPDPRYSTCCWLSIRFNCGENARFRMKSTTAKALYQILAANIST